MMGFGMGSGMIAMTVFWVGLVVLVIWAVSRTSTGGGGRDEKPPQETPEEILDRRYVAGELDDAEYRSKRETLTSTRSTPR